VIETAPFDFKAEPRNPYPSVWNRLKHTSFVLDRAETLLRLRPFGQREGQKLTVGEFVNNVSRCMVELADVRVLEYFSEYPGEAPDWMKEIDDQRHFAFGTLYCDQRDDSCHAPSLIWDESVQRFRWFHSCFKFRWRSTDTALYFAPRAS